MREALSHALQYSRSGRPTRDYATAAAIAAAEHLAEALRLNGYVLMRLPPAPNHAGAVPAHSLLPPSAAPPSPLPESRPAKPASEP